MNEDWKDQSQSAARELESFLHSALGSKFKKKQWDKAGSSSGRTGKKENADYFVYMVLKAVGV